METFIPLTELQVGYSMLGNITLKTISGLKAIHVHVSQYTLNVKLEDNTEHYYTKIGRYLPYNTPSDFDLVIDKNLEVDTDIPLYKKHQ